MRGRFGRLTWLVLATAGASAGCIVPSYHLPAGFSSSYERQIYGMDPAPPPVDGGLAAITTSPGIFYPMTAFRDQPNTCTNANANRPPGPMVLGTDPLSPPPKVVERPPLDISVN
ncbi:MAG TPA: hypothetical protein VFG04_11710 [Planctomycetaceae bacterium]|jgi:hypothetical protein|nr:hypothetical protein [Planctomycetaceae bacterium]